MAKKFYAVKQGRNIGIYDSWEKCKAQIHGFSGASYKSFLTLDEAKAYLGEEKEDGDTEKSRLGEKDQMRADKEHLIAYVDGSFHQVSGVYGSGAVILNGEEEIHLYDSGNNKEMAAMRNVAGEILASEAAMRYAVEQGAKSILIVHDYEGIARWCLGEWKANKTGTLRYQQAYQELKDKVEIHFRKVKGHSGDKYNDIADMLAKKAVGLE